VAGFKKRMRVLKKRTRVLKKRTRVLKKKRWVLKKTRRFFRKLCTGSQRKPQFFGWQGRFSNNRQL
jgi:hypothetical protein